MCGEGIVCGSVCVAKSAHTLIHNHGIWGREHKAVASMQRGGGGGGGCVIEGGGGGGFISHTGWYEGPTNGLCSGGAG